MRPPLFLIGFMASGKTSVGRAIAEREGRRFVDLDDVIAAMGEPVASLVARDEAEFRRREASALAQVIADDAVIATGGGAAAHGDNLARMLARGVVVALGVDVAEAQRRAAGGPARPLLGQAEALAARRAPIYRRAHAVVDTTNKSIAQVADEVTRVEGLVLATKDRGCTVVALGERSYPVTVTQAIELPAVSATRIAIITDDNVATHWLAPVRAALPVADVFTIRPGEASKSFAVYQQLCNDLVARGLDRASLIIGLGGGVVGDLAGFVAATLFRGIPIIHVPTTIVAMTDSAIGGKTAIDLPAGKNLVGAFWQPRLVACGLETLTTLPARERRAGFGELWKYALLDGPEMWRAVSACAAWAAGAEGIPAPSEMVDVIRRAIAYKAAVVGRDERELTGHRALLNLGHTVGHAIESAAAGAVLHGEAVGLGLVAAARISAAIAGARSTLADEVIDALRSSGLPADLDPWLTDEVLAWIGVDKKRAGKGLKFIVAREVGVCEPLEITVNDVGRILRPKLPA
ncbi:MAG: 3-dehydroquinate synthase [Kofleriaceae bacterium]|nr:3-dehydroquinate synthase [Kofleriaceae bacterium]